MKRVYIGTVVVRRAKCNYYTTTEAAKSKKGRREKARKTRGWKPKKTPPPLATIIIDIYTITLK
jgi:hypothetical protein